MLLENQCAPGPSVQGLIRKGDVSRRKLDQSRDQFKKGCLSAPAGTYDADPFMAPSREGDILDGGDGAVSGLIDLGHSLAGQFHDSLNVFGRLFFLSEDSIRLFDKARIPESILLDRSGEVILL